jgi:hypothetical protein
MARSHFGAFFELGYVCAAEGRSAWGPEGFMRLNQRRLYPIQGTVLPMNADPVSADNIRFQHFFRVTDFAYQ